MVNFDVSHQMNEITASLSSVAWWFTAVAVAVIVNLASAYLKDGSDRVWRYARRKLDDRRTVADAHERQVAESNAEFLKQLKFDESLRRFLFEAEVRARLLSLELLIMGMGCAALGYYVMGNPLPHMPSLFGRAVGLFSVLVIFVGGQQFSFAHALSKVLVDVQRLRKLAIAEKPREDS